MWILMASYMEGKKYSEKCLFKDISFQTDQILLSVKTSCYVCNVYRHILVRIDLLGSRDGALRYTTTRTSQVLPVAWEIKECFFLSISTKLINRLFTITAFIHFPFPHIFLPAQGINMNIENCPWIAVNYSILWQLMVSRACCINSVLHVLKWFSWYNMRWDDKSRSRAKVSMPHKLTEHGTW